MPRCSFRLTAETAPHTRSGMQRYNLQNMPLDLLVADFYEGRTQAAADAVLDPSATFTCEQFHCQMTVGTCVKRQLAGSRAGRPIHAPCGRVDGAGRIDEATGTSPCDQGNQHFVQIGTWRPDAYRAVPHNWSEIRAISRGLAKRTTGRD